MDIRDSRISTGDALIPRAEIMDRARLESSDEGFVMADRVDAPGLASIPATFELRPAISEPPRCRSILSFPPRAQPLLQILTNGFPALTLSANTASHFRFWNSQSYT